MTVYPYQLALEADRHNSAVVDELITAGIPVEHYMTAIAPEDVPRARAALGLPAEPPTQEPRRSPLDHFRPQRRDGR